MLIELLDFWIDVNCHGSRNLLSSALSERKESAARDDQRRSDKRGWGGPIAKDKHARNNHPDKLGVGKWRQRRRGRVSMGDDQHSVASGPENAHHGHDQPSSR
jgi:hypothetical protein